MVFAGYFDTPMDGNPYLLRDGQYVNLYEAARVIQKVAPAAGATVTVSDKATHLLINNPALLATLTVVFPTPYVNRSLRIASRSAITLLTLSAPGRTIYGTIAGLAAASYAEFLYTSDDNAWFRMG